MAIFSDIENNSTSWFPSGEGISGWELPQVLKETTQKVRASASIFCYLAARCLVHPHWKITDRWLATVSLCKDAQSKVAQKVDSIMKSTLISCALLPLALGGLVMGQALHLSAYALAPTPYIHLKGKPELKEPSDQLLSLFQLNCCLTAGGFSRLFGGLARSDGERTKEIAALVRENNPDLACLQEVSDLTQAVALYRELSSEFSEFYFHMGTTPWILQNNSGLFVASKIAIDQPALHSFSDIPGTESMVNKCFFLFSTKLANLIVTHLSPSPDDLHPKDTEIQVRAEEQTRILSAAEQRASENHKPTFILGDLNINRDGPEYKQGLLFQKCSDKQDQEVTCETKYLVRRNWHHEREAAPQGLKIDYFLSLQSPDQPVIDTQTIATFDPAHPEAALSDHAALKTKVTFT